MLSPAPPFPPPPPRTLLPSVATAWVCAGLASRRSGVCRFRRQAWVCTLMPPASPAFPLAHRITPAWACTLLPPGAAVAFAGLCRPEIFIAARRTGMGLYGCLTDVWRTRLVGRGGALDGGASACASGGGASGGASGGGARGSGARGGGAGGGGARGRGVCCAACGAASCAWPLQLARAVRLSLKPGHGTIDRNKRGRDLGIPRLNQKGYGW